MDSSTLVWIHFPEVPIAFFEDQMGNLVGRAVKVDDTTMEVSRGIVCVLNFQKIPLLLGYSQLVEYDHLICFYCGEYGHRMEGCPQKGGVDGSVQNTSINDLR